MTISLSNAFADQQDLLFSTGNLQTLKVYRSAALVATVDGVVGEYPSKLSGVTPGDLRVRVRASDVSSLVPLSTSTDTLRFGYVSYTIVSIVSEFNGLGLCLQARVATGAVAHLGETYLSIPTMTLADRAALGTSLNVGTVIFQTDNTPGLRVWNSSNWVRFTETID
jgi:hypothetical protein